jgi:hypothetical protein
MRLCTAFYHRRCISLHDKINAREREREERGREGGRERERESDRERERASERERLACLWFGV